MYKTVNFVLFSKISNNCISVSDQSKVSASSPSHSLLDHRVQCQLDMSKSNLTGHWTIAHKANSVILDWTMHGSPDNHVDHPINAYRANSVNPDHCVQIHKLSCLYVENRLLLILLSCFDSLKSVAIFIISSPG